MKRSSPSRPRFGPSLSLGLAGLLVLAACGGGSDDDDATPVTEGAPSGAVAAADGPSSDTVLRVGDQGQGLELPLRLSGELDAVPYELEFATFASGPLVNEAFAAEAIDVGMMGDTPALLSFASGLDTVAVGIRASDGVTATLVARPGSGIESLEDLAGHSVAFTTGSNQHGFVLRALDSVGLEPDDIDHVDVPLSDVANVLAGGQADAAVLYEVYRPAYLAEHPDAVELITLRDLVPSYLYLLAARDAVEDPDKAAAIEDLVARLARSGAWVEQHPDQWIDAYYVDVQKQTVEYGTSAYAASGTSTWIPANDDVQQTQQEQADLFHEAGFLPDEVDVSPQFDPSITRPFNTAIQEALR